MCTRSILFCGTTLDLRICGVSVCTVELRKLTVLESYISFVMQFFGIHQNMGPAQCIKAS
jgi:hypothetical protein